MRTVTYAGAISLDGFLAGADGSIDWLHFSQDVQDLMTEYWANVDTILMGRKTYAVAQAQPKPASRKPMLRTYVFSRTLNALAEPGVELVTDDAAEFVKALKRRPGKGICLVGGGELAQSLLGAGLVDRIGLNIHPVLLGAGIPAFRDAGQRLKLSLIECRPLEGGCILANYDVLHASDSSDR
jgi:dihydrofolate reductase